MLNLLVRILHSRRLQLHFMTTRLPGPLARNPKIGGNSSPLLLEFWWRCCSRPVWPDTICWEQHKVLQVELQNGPVNVTKAFIDPCVIFIQLWTKQWLVSLEMDRISVKFGCLPTQIMPENMTVVQRVVVFLHWLAQTPTIHWQPSAKSRPAQQWVQQRQRLQQL